MKYTRPGPRRFAHQTEGLKRLIQQRGVGALLFDPGLGKTSTVIDYLGALALKQQELRVLVICPLAAVDTWVTQLDTYLTPGVSYWAEVLRGRGSGYSILHRAEALASRGGRPFRTPLVKKTKHKTLPKDRGLHANRSDLLQIRDSRLFEYSPTPTGWGEVIKTNKTMHARAVHTPDDLPAPRLILEVLNIDSLSSRRAYGSKTVADVMVDAIQRFDPGLVVVDESHMIKSASSNSSRLLARIARTVPRRIILTGTVMPHSPLDAFGQWRFLDPRAFSEGGQPMTFSQFKNRFAQMGGFMGKEILGFQRLDEMQDVMARLAVVAKKEDALDLPATTDVVVPVELSPAERKAYAEMKGGLATDLRNGTSVTATSMLVQGLRLRQITAGHVRSDDGTVQTVGTSKADTIRSIVNDSLLGENRVVVFALFKAEMEQLAKALAVKGTDVMVIGGQTPNDERIRLRKRFGSDDPQRMVMIAQVRTMSLAVNELVTASHAVFATLSQQRDHYVQARDRLNRLGQTKPVTFWHAIAPGTVDEVVLTSHKDRTSLEDAMLKHIAED